MSEKPKYILTNEEMKIWMESLFKKVHTMSPETKDAIDVLSKGLSKIQSHFEKNGVICQIKEEIVETKEHVKTTNGKVAENTKWRNYLTAFAILVSFLFPTITGIFVYFVKDMKSDIRLERQIEINNLVGNAVEKYLEDNFEPIE